jgi:pimeloyl-ACP methyl ester carboxylesterase
VIERDVAIGDVTLHTEAFGAPDCPPVLLIMGAMASGRWWPDDFCRQLAAHGRYVIRYDHRDTGASTSYPPADVRYTVEDLADDGIGVLTAYGIRQAHLIGMSLGGYLCQIIGLKYPDHAASLTLIASEALEVFDPSIPGIDPAVLAYHAKAADLDWSDREAVLHYQVDAWRLLSGSAHPFDEAAIRTIAGADFDRTPNPLSAFNHATLAEPTNWLGRLSSLRPPVLIIHGTEDRVVSYAHAMKLHAAIPSSRLVSLPGTGHELHRSDWPAILRAIVEHTNGSSGKG